jgi:hypothetical protein
LPGGHSKSKLRLEAKAADLSDRAFTTNPRFGCNDENDYQTRR